MKKNYSKPSMKVFNLKQRQMILCASGEQEQGVPPSDYDDYFAFIPGDMNNMA